MTSVDAPTKPARKRAQQKPAVVDRATQYAHRVLLGEIIAGPHVRDAAARHLRDLTEAPARGLRWNLDAAAWAIAFFEETL